MFCFFLLAGFLYAPQILIEDNELYRVLTKHISRPFIFDYFFNCASQDNNAWKQKMMEDKEFVMSLLSLDSGESWGLLSSLAGHPDAKSLMPTEVVKKAGSAKGRHAINIFALLCSEIDLKSLEVDSAYIEQQCKLLDDILTTGSAVCDNTPYYLLTILRPIANLSAADSYKENLGKRGVKLLLRVVNDSLPSTEVVTKHMKQSRSISAKILWNLAYLKPNCTRIQQENGFSRLEKTKADTTDPELKRLIEGILHMCNTALDLLPKNIAIPLPSSRKHVMISYNWDNQSIVLRIAQSLKDHGYKVWIDTEQMGGSTLEAMAVAIENSDLVLICMSQKYKDSPNCRLEGEYCVNKRITFVPLMMQKGYAPDGWLGIALGSKLWYDFTNDTDWNVKVAGLTKAIGERGKAQNETTEESNTKPTPKTGNKVIDWTQEDILRWMQAENIDQAEEYFELLRKHKVNGKALLELKYFLNNPKHFSFLCKEMGIGEVGIVLQLAAAIRKL